MKYRVMMIIDGNEYAYGTYRDRNRANEIAMEVREQREVETYVEEVE